MVRLHRWTGLLMAAFLIVEALTGSMLAYRVPLERLYAPQLFAWPRPYPPLALAQLAIRAESLVPRARVGYFSLEDRQAVMHLRPRTNPATGRPFELDVDRLFLDPWTGKELGRRLEGDLSQGMINLIPFVYRLHMSLAAGEGGSLVLGLVALAWTIDCFVGIYLTFPISWPRFLARWKLAWLVKLRARPVRANYDLHRAGGLWLSPLLFIFGWSSVMFNLPQVYTPVTKTLFDYRDSTELPAGTLHQNPTPRLGWAAAQAAGQRALGTAAQRLGFTIDRPYGMAYIEEFGVYTYAVASDRNIQAHGWATSVWIDGDSGTLVSVDLPSTERTGNYLELWLRALHFADLRDSWIYRLAVCFLGFAITGLSVTGIYICLKKRRARRFARDAAGFRRAGILASVLASHALAIVWLTESRVIVTRAELPSLTVDLVAPDRSPAEVPVTPPVMARLSAPSVELPIPPSIAISPNASEAPLHGTVNAASTPEAPATSESIVEPAGVDLELQCPRRNPPSYPPQARHDREQGDVRLRVEIDESGRIASANVVTSSGSRRLDEAARTAVLSWHCTPARIDGRPVRAVAFQTLSFVLESR